MTAPRSSQRIGRGRTMVTVAANERHRALLERLLVNAARFDQELGFVQVDRTSRSHIAFVDCEGLRLCVKIYEDKWSRWHQTWFRVSRAQREFEALALLRERFGNPMREICWGELRCYGIVRRCIVVTSAWPHAIDLRRLRARKKARGGSLSEQLRLETVAHEVMRFLAELHQQRFLLNEGWGKNLLVADGDRQPTDPLWTWIDQPRLVRRASISLRDRAFELAKIGKYGSDLLTRTQLLRCFHTYCDAAGVEPTRELRLRVLRHVEHLHAWTLKRRLSILLRKSRRRRVRQRGLWGGGA